MGFVVGEQVRSIEAEKAYNRRWLVGLIVGLLLLNVLGSLWMFSAANRLPDELAIHWNGNNEVDDWTSLWVIALTSVLTSVGVGGIIAAIAVVSRGQNLLIARIGAGVGVGFGVGLAALMIAIVTGQIDLVDTSQAKVSGPVMGAGLAVAAVLGSLVMWLYKPGELDRTPSAEVLAVNALATAEDSAVSLAASERAARSETMQIKVSMGKWTWVLSVGLGAIVALSTYFIFPVLALLGVVIGAITWIFCQGTAVIGPDGVKVLASGFWKVMPLDWKEIRSASVEDIKALDYGGWGYRMNGGSVGFIMGNGPALVMECGFHQKFVITMPDPQTAGEAAALINAYIHNGKVKN